MTAHSNYIGQNGSLRKNRWIIRLTPVITTSIFGMSTLGHVARMWSERSAEGQSLTSWLLAMLALLMWYNWYLVVAPEERTARWSCLASVALESLAVISIIRFRYFP